MILGFLDLELISQSQKTSILLQGDNKALMPHTMDVDVLTCPSGHLGSGSGD